MEFKPSQVQFSSFPPFVGTFDRTETECTAAVIVKTLALRGDTWRAIDCSELAAVFDELTGPKNSDWHKLFNNPFITVDLHGLVDRGYAAWRKAGKAIEFTEIGRGRLEKWVNFGNGEACHG